MLEHGLFFIIFISTGPGLGLLLREALEDVSAVVAGARAQGLLPPRAALHLLVQLRIEGWFNMFVLFFERVALGVGQPPFHR